ncbi:MAG TPA: DUF481 domain-containing protein [Hanamia sp.]|nr:DUF481 domain-containing protein [Hanamia sp.]
MFIHKIIAFFISVFISTVALSQFNDSTHHHFKFASTGTINQTKDLSSYVLNNMAAYEINQKKLTFNTSASWIYGRQQHQLSNNDVSADANIDYLKNVHPLYYWGLFSFDESYSLKINYRFQSGIGVGYTFVNKPHFKLVASDGFVYETSDLTDPVLGKDIYQTVRNSFRVKYRWAYKDIFVLEGAEYVQPSLISLKDYILKSSNTLSVKLNTWLAINASVGYNKISRTNRENLLITYGLTVDKYF